MSERAMARADLLTAIVLFALAAAVVYGSWTMDRLPVRRIHPLSVPGLTPGILGAFLGVASVTLFVQALRRGAATGLAGTLRLRRGEERSALWRLGLAVLLCLGYALGLIGRMPYWLATTAFVFAFIALFEWEPAASARRRLGRLAAALAIGLATGLSVSYAFSQLFLVRLP